MEASLKTEIQCRITMWNSLDEIEICRTGIELMRRAHAARGPAIRCEGGRCMILPDGVMKSFWHPADFDADLEMCLRLRQIGCLELRHWDAPFMQFRLTLLGLEAIGAVTLPE